MRIVVLVIFLLGSMPVVAQRINQVPDTLRKPETGNQDKTAKIVQDNEINNVTAEDVIKKKLVSIALKNPIFQIDDANIAIAEANRRKAGTALLGTVGLGGNINEFVINNSPTANFYPKYNFGLNLPFDIFSKIKNEKKVTEQTILIAEGTKKQHEQEITAETLTRYENYKEKADLVTLQNISLANNLSDYQLAQKNFEDGTITIEALNRIYQNYMGERSKLVTAKKDLNVAVIELEEMLGMPLAKAVPGLITR